MDRAADLLVSQLVEELVRERLGCVQSLLWAVDHHLRDEIQQQRIRLREDLLPLPLLYLWELVIVEVVFRVHLCHLRLGWSSQHFDDLDEVVKTAFPDEQRTSI